MRAIQIAEYGNAEVLKIKELPMPTPGKGEALVKVKAIGLNFIDIYMRTGRYPRALPFTPGLEASGVVEAIGDGVTEVKVGDHVAYTSSIGSYAEFNVVKADQLIPLPADLSFEEAAAFPLQGMTAQYLTHEQYPVKQNTTVLVHAAAGGMGLLLVQWLKHMGAIVIGTVSTEEKAKLAKDAGADHIINYAKQDFVTEVMNLTGQVGVDYIIDGVGKTTFTKDLDAARIHGYICLYGSASGPADPFSPNALQARSLTVAGGLLFNYINTRDQLLKRANAVLEGMREGWLKLKIDHVLPLKEASKAQSLLESRKTTGKVILTTGV